MDLFIENTIKIFIANNHRNHKWNPPQAYAWKDKNLFKKRP